MTPTTLSPQQQILARCRAVVDLAMDILRMDLSTVRISFDLRGRAAGCASRRGNDYSIRFNNDMLGRAAFQHVHDNTVPHEYAHAACFMNPTLGRNHDAGWARVCRDLGGSGATRHQEEVIFGRGTTYEYTTDAGHQVRIGDRHHKYLALGRRLSFRRGLGNITQLSPYRIVGVNGHSVEAINTSVLTQPAEPERVIAPAVEPTARNPVQGNTSKAAVSRQIMSAGFAAGHSYETIIAQMMAANGYTRQLARATFKANAPKVGIPETFA